MAKLTSPIPRIKINGKTHVACVLLVTGRDEHGRPRECRMVHPEETVDLTGDTKEFLVVFAQENSVSARHN